MRTLALGSGALSTLRATGQCEARLPVTWPKGFAPRVPDWSRAWPCLAWGVTFCLKVPCTEPGVADEYLERVRTPFDPGTRLEVRDTDDGRLAVEVERVSVERQAMPIPDEAAWSGWEWVVTLRRLP